MQPATPLPSRPRARTFPPCCSLSRSRPGALRASCSPASRANSPPPASAARTARSVGSATPCASAVATAAPDSRGMRRALPGAASSSRLPSLPPPKKPGARPSGALTYPSRGGFFVRVKKNQIQVQRALLARESKKTCEFPAEMLCPPVGNLCIPSPRVCSAPSPVAGSLVGTAWSQTTRADGFTNLATVHSLLDACRSLADKTPVRCSRSCLS